MLVVLEVAVLITTLLVQSVKGQGCNTGWFGENCAFMCLCFSSNDCGISGECPRRACSFPHFGPGCQYEDLVSSHSSPSNPRYIGDMDENTCNTDTESTFVEVTISHASPFSWITIHVKNIINILNFTLQFNNGDSCGNEMRFINKDDHEVDITCSTYLLLKTLRITGPIAPSICSVYISGGRNVALKQQASQSSIDPSQSVPGSADRAVDGITNTTFEAGSCTETNREEEPFWVLTFSRPQIIIKVLVLNRNDTLGSQLKGFHLETFSKFGATTNYYKEYSHIIKPLYVIYLPSKKESSSLKITASRDDVHSNQTLTICEVQVFGENVCPYNTFGLWCEHMCRCAQYETCHRINGACSPGCPIGFYGDKCSIRCITTCNGRHCDYITGRCTKCPSGYKGYLCKEECDDGSFGEDCGTNCSENCNDLCDHETGRCICKSGFAGTQCTECPVGYFGEDCKSPCSKNCKDVCEKSGNCTCKPEAMGPKCLECSKTHYGIACDLNCPENCLDGICGQITGNCKACINDYSGLKCRDDPQGALPIIIILSVALLGLIMVISVPCYLKGKRPSPRQRNKHKRSRKKHKKRHGNHASDE